MALNTIILISFLFTVVVCTTPVGGNEKRLIKTSEDLPAVWMTPEDIRQQFECPYPSYVDITNDPGFSLRNAPVPNTNAIPRDPRFQSTVKELLPKVNRSRLYEFVRHFSEDYNTRHYQTEEGEACEKWLHAEVISVLSSYHGHSSVSEVTHTWRQNSVIARLHGNDPLEKSERVIIGAHIDSRTFKEFDNGNINERAPGADDDATGSAILMETLRILVEGDIRPKKTVEIHWYAGEEAGLLGSVDIARSYKIAGVEVAAMLQFDIPGFQGPNATDIGISIDADQVNPEVAQLARVLTDEYLDFGWRNWTCDYACSDHAAWTANGYPAGLVAEIDFEQWDKGCYYHHTVNDTIERISFTQVMEMVKIAVGFTVEIGEPMSAN